MKYSLREERRRPRQPGNDRPRRDSLHFLWRNGGWNGPHRLTGSAGGNPVLIQSRFGGKGNFELVYPDKDRGIRFMWRNNG